LAISDFFVLIALEQMLQSSAIVVVITNGTDMGRCLEKAFESVLASIMVNEPAEKGCDDEKAINFKVQLF
jgi:hypothetical protein